MPKEGSIEFKGVVLELLPNAMFKVKLENDHEILAHSSGKMRNDVKTSIDITSYAIKISLVLIFSPL